MYDGSSDLGAFEKFCYETDQRMLGSGVGESWIIRTVSPGLSGKAAQFFMSSVAPDPDKWTLERLYNSLFKYCFPVDIRLRLRERLIYLKQGNQKFEDFVREIERLRIRVPNITERQITQTIWDGVSLEVRKELTKQRFNPEYSDQMNMIDAIEAIEAAFELEKSEIDHENGKNTSDGWSEPSSDLEMEDDRGSDSMYKPTKDYDSVTDSSDNGDEDADASDSSRNDCSPDKDSSLYENTSIGFSDNSSDHSNSGFVEYISDSDAENSSDDSSGSDKRREIRLTSTL
jgi:hypothetical protein